MSARRSIGGSIVDAIVLVAATAVIVTAYYRSEQGSTVTVSKQDWSALILPGCGMNLHEGPA